MGDSDAIRFEDGVVSVIALRVKPDDITGVRVA